MNKEYLEKRLSDLDQVIANIKIEIEKASNELKNKLEQMMAHHNMLIGRREEVKEHLQAISNPPASEPEDKKEELINDA